MVVYRLGNLQQFLDRGPIGALQPFRGFELSLSLFLPPGLPIDFSELVMNGAIPRCLLQRLLQPVLRLGRLSLPQVGLAQPLISIEDRLAGGENTFEKFDRLVHSILGIGDPDRKSTRLNSSHLVISYAVFCLKKKKEKAEVPQTTLERTVKAQTLPEPRPVV